MNEDDSIKCVCGKKYELDNFINHFNKCELFYIQYKDFDFKIVQLLKQFITSRESLIIIIFLLNRFIESLKNKLKKNNFKNKLKYFKSDKGPLTFKKTISSELSKDFCYNYRACLFSSKFDNNIYAVYGTLKYDLECYDILNDTKFTLINKLYNDTFHSCRYFYDSKEKRDLILTCFSKENKIKVINFQKEKSRIILKIQMENTDLLIRTVFFLDEKIIIPLTKEPNNGEVHIYDIETKEQKSLSDNLYDIFFINNYYDKNSNLNYTLLCNRNNIFVYLIDKMFLDKVFIIDEENDSGYFEAYLIEKNGRLILIGALLSSYKVENLYIWDFEKVHLIKKVNIKGVLTDINIWDQNYIFASFLENDYLFALIDINNCSIVKKFENNIQEECYGVKVLRDIKKGDFLILLTSTGVDLYTINSSSMKFNKKII